MKNIKKVFVVLLSVAIVLSCAACGSNSTNTNDSGNSVLNGEGDGLSSEELLKQIPSELKGSTIKYMMWYDGKAESEGPIISAFTNLTGINVEIEIASYADFATELATRVAADNAPDVVRCRNNGVSAVKMLQPLSNLNYKFSDEVWDKKTMSDYTFNGKTYATNLKNTIYFDAAVVFYNSQILKDYGLEDPYTLWKGNKWTWDKFWGISENFVSQGGSYGACFEPMRLLSLVEGVDFLDNVDGKYINNINDPSKNAKLLSSWTDTLNRQKLGLLTNKTWMMSDFNSGKSAFFVTSISAGFSKRSYFEQYKSLGELMCVPLPTSEKSENYTVMSENSAWGVPVGAKNPEAVPYFLRYMLDFNNYNTSDLFADQTMLEVFNSLKASEKRYSAVLDTTLSQADNGTDYHIMETRISNGEVSQINTTLQQFVGNIQDAVDKANEQVKQMK